MAALEVAAGDPGGVGRQQRQQAESWLQLKQDQTAFREGVESLTPHEANGLDQLEQRQQVDASRLEQQQRQSLGTDWNLGRGAGVEDPVPLRKDLERRREFERQRLEMRIQREMLRPGLR